MLLAMKENINIGTILYLPSEDKYWLCIDAISVGQGNDPEWKTVRLIGYLGSAEAPESEEISNFTICRNINGEIKNIYFKIDSTNKLKIYYHYDLDKLSVINFNTLAPLNDIEMAILIDIRKAVAWYNECQVSSDLLDMRGNVYEVNNPYYKLFIPIIFVYSGDDYGFNGYVVKYDGTTELVYKRYEMIKSKFTLIGHLSVNDFIKYRRFYDNALHPLVDKSLIVKIGEENQ